MKKGKNVQREEKLEQTGEHTEGRQKDKKREDKQSGERQTECITR